MKGEESGGISEGYYYDGMFHKSLVQHRCHRVKMMNSLHDKLCTQNIMLSIISISMKDLCKECSGHTIIATMANLKVCPKATFKGRYR